MNEHEVMEQLKQEAGFFEVSKVSTFRGYRETVGGDNQEVTIEIRDAGPDAGLNRYACTARSENGKTVTGNEAATLDEAITIVHWNELD